MTIPRKLQVDFSEFEIDLIDHAMNLLPMRYSKSHVMRQFLSTLVNEVQQLYDAIIELQRQRTLFDADGANLDGLGRIVGEDRTQYAYSDKSWVAFDRPAQAFDSMPFWCIGAPLAEYLPAKDSQYQKNILSRILKNHTLTGSPIELSRQLAFATGLNISFEKTGFMQVRLVVPSEISITDLINYTVPKDTRYVDSQYVVPYPATLDIAGFIIYAPSKFFCFDRADDHQFDSGNFGVAAKALA